MRNTTQNEKNEALTYFVSQVCSLLVCGTREIALIISTMLQGHSPIVLVNGTWFWLLY